MTLKDGSYFIRFVPPNIIPPFIGGSYATAGEIGHPIHILAKSSSYNQVWDVKQVENEYYLITIQKNENEKPGVEGENLERAGFALGERGSGDDRQIILSLTPQPLNFMAMPANRDVFSVHVPPQGVTVNIHYLVTAVDDTVVCQTKTVSSEFQKSGRWQFFPAE